MIFSLSFGSIFIYCLHLFVCLRILFTFVFHLFSVSLRVLCDIYIYINVWERTHMCACACHRAYVEDRGQLVGINYLLPPYTFIF